MDGPYTEQGMTIKVNTPYEPILMYQQNNLYFTKYFSFRTSTRGNQVTYIDEFFKNSQKSSKIFLSLSFLYSNILYFRKNFDFLMTQQKTL